MSATITLTVVSIGAETVAEFILRHGGVANTANIAARFGWDMRTARRNLENAARRGELEKMPAHEWPLGRVCSWRLARGSAQC